MSDQGASPRTHRTGAAVRPSLSDVARLAGVAPITVSRVASGKSNVKIDTRDRVLSAMDELGYRPNRAARALRTGRYGTIGIVASTLATYGNMRTIEGITVAARDAGFSTTLMSTEVFARDDSSTARDFLALHDIDGIIVILEASALEQSDLRFPDSFPVVVADGGGASQYPLVDSDQQSGAALATAHLLSLGHSTVFHIAGPASSFAAAQRATAWRATLEKAGAPVPPEFVGDWTSGSGHRLGAELAAMPEVTAIFAANDQMALGAMLAMHEAGRDIPRDVSVVGFDDTPDSGAFWPPLTTVRQHFDIVGSRLVEALIGQFDDGQVEQSTRIVPVELVVRASTAAPAHRP